MTVRLPKELKRALARSGNKVAYVEDAETKAAYVLLPKVDYERLQSLLAVESGSVADTYAAQERMAKADGWDNPLMDEYNHYDRKKTA
jgi:hypothetical protein